MEQQEFEIREEGAWSEVIAFCDELSQVLPEYVSQDVCDRFEEWRPKPEETKKQLHQKTAEEAAIQKTKLEKESKGPVKEMSNASKGVRKSGKDMVKRNPRESVRDVEDAGSSAAKGLFPPFIRLFRVIEEILYVNVMGKTNPNYFEGKGVTVSIERELLHRDRYKVRAMFDEKAKSAEVMKKLEA